MGIALNDPNFKGVQRDGIPIGDRIFRMPYFDPQGQNDNSAVEYKISRC